MTPKEQAERAIAKLDTGKVTTAKLNAARLALKRAKMNLRTDDGRTETT